MKKSIVWDFVTLFALLARYSKLKVTFASKPMNLAPKRNIFPFQSNKMLRKLFLVENFTAFENNIPEVFLKSFRLCNDTVRYYAVSTPEK